MYEFAPDFKTIGTIAGTATIAELANETGMYSASLPFLRRNGGPIVQRILDAIPPEWYQLCQDLGMFPNGDVRIHRLYPGDFPAYPGWHCDGEYRETYFSQPDLDKIPLSKHIICCVSSDADGVSNPEFLLDPITVPVDMSRWNLRVTEQQHTLWAVAHKAVEANPNLRRVSIPDGHITEFGCRSLHRVMPARIRGWRLFFRLSMWHKPNLGDGGCLTRQEQVYQVIGNHGW